MTTTRYFIARFARFIGIQRRNRRLAEAAVESHLLREAEQMLGKDIWENVEDVEELGIEYWNLRRLTAERIRLHEALEQSENALAEAHEQRATLLGSKTTNQDELEADRKKILAELDSLAKARDRVISRAREVRRLYEGLKTKLEVLKLERRDDPDVMSQTRERMAELRSQFDVLKEERDEVACRIDLRDKELDRVDRLIAVERKKHRDEAAEAFQVIGEANRNISSFKAELGLIETRMWQLYGEIGRHVSRNVSNSATCRRATSSQRPLVEVMAALRKSITFNQRLTEH